MRSLLHLFCFGIYFLAPPASATQVNFLQVSLDDSKGTVIGAVSTDQWLQTGKYYTTVIAPDEWNGFRFTRWTNSSQPNAVYRDAWGRSVRQASFVLLEDTTFTAHYIPSTLDSNGDDVPDWYKLEFFGTLNVAAADDQDGDGYTLLEEYQNGTHPLYANSTQEGGVSSAISSLITFNRDGYPIYRLRSEPGGTVDQLAAAPPGTIIATPYLDQNTFGYWTLDGVPQRDAWGVALRQISFTMDVENREAVAYFYGGDADGDGLSDAWEWFYLGTEEYDGSEQFHGDGFTLLQNYLAGRAPTFGYSFQAGGVAWADSEIVTVNLAGYARYTLASDPLGKVDQSAVVPTGTMIITPNLTQTTFGYWVLDGIPERDPWGVALRQISFTVNGEERTAIAHFFDGDSDSDGIPDAWEIYHFGTLEYDAHDSPVGADWTLMTAYQAGGSPVFAESHQPGGVSWADSAMVIVNLQPFDRLSKILVDGVLTDFFSFDPNVASGIQTSTWASTAVTDWDGDGNYDLFVAHQDGLRVFRNIGTGRNPNFSEVQGGYDPLASYISGIERPIIAGGDWNNDGFGDLVVGGNTDTLRFVPSTGVFTSNGNGWDLTLPSARISPALADMNGDGLADLLVLLDDGTVTLFLNNGTAIPFSGIGVPNILGVPAPEGISITAGDLNQDGLTDVLLADQEGRIWEFINNGSGFSLQSKVWGGSFPGFAGGLTLTAVDIEGDGDLDLIAGLANGGIIALRDPSVSRPTGLIARPGANSIQLDWDASWQPRIRGYYIYRSNDADGAFGKLRGSITQLPSYLDANLNRELQYYYYVTGVSQFFLPGNSTPRILEGLPSDLAITQSGKAILTLRPARGNPGQKIRINLSIENATGVSGEDMQLRVAYDPVKLIPWAQVNPGRETVTSTGLSRNLTFTDNGETANGELVIDGSGGALEPGAGKLFTLQFRVAPTVPKRTVLGVSVNDATMFDTSGQALIVEINQPLPPEADDIYFEGDVNGDGILSQADQMLLIELIKPRSRQPTAEELMAGDLNGDGKIDQRDLVLLIQLLNSN